MKNKVLVDTIKFLRENGLSNDFLIDVALGKVKGHSLVQKYGRNPNIIIADGFASLWNGGGFYTGFNATGAEIVSVSSSVANDSSDGTGARTVRLFGLDSEYKEQTEDVILNGLNIVNTSKSFLRLDRIKTTSAGSVGSNIGEITAKQSITTANVFAVMPIGYNSTMISAFTIPAGKTALLYDLFATFSGGKKAAYSNVRIYMRELGGVFTVEGEASLHSEGSSTVSRIYRLPVKIDQKTDIYIAADTNNDDIAVSGAFDLLLVDNQ